MLIKPFNEVVYVERNVDLTSFLPHLNTFKDQLDILLSQPYIHVQTDEQVGNVITTAARQYALKSLQGYDELIKCLLPYFEIARDSLYDHPGGIEIHRSWVNVMNKDSSGIVHDHGEKCLVGVFYLNAPLNSGKFVIADNSKDSDRTYQLDIAQSMFICHRNSVLHAVSKHDSNESRVSIIIEAKVVLNKGK